MNITAIIRKAGDSNILTTYTKEEGRKRRQMMQCVLCHEFNAIAEQNAGKKKCQLLMVSDMMTKKNYNLLLTISWDQVMKLARA